MTLSATVNLNLSATLQSALDLVTPAGVLTNKNKFTLTNGTGANQADTYFSDQRTLAASATEDLDLAGVLTDIFGAAITFAKIKVMSVKAAAGNTNNVEVGGAASNQFATFLGDVSDQIIVPPGGQLVLVAPDANGFAVTAGTGDLLRMGNGGGGTSVTYDIILIGVKA